MVSWKTREFWPCCSEGSGALWQCIVGKKQRDRTGRANDPVVGGARGWMCVGVLYGLSLMALKMATFDRDVDFWRSYGAGGRNSVEKIELEAETQSWIDVGNGHVVHQMTQKIVALSPISRPRIYCSFLLTFLTLGCFFYGLGLFIFKVKSRMPACVSL